MESSLKVVLSSASIGFMLTGCMYGENKQFFDEGTGSVGATSPSIGTTDGSNPITASPTSTPIAQATPSPTPNSNICVENPTAAACNETPVVTTPGVVTILFTMSQIPQDSGALFLTNAIKYASPVANPKILFMKDSNTAGEDEGDPAYIQNALLAGYNVQYGVIAAGGLNPSEVAGKDLVIVSNPGHPLSDAKTLETLKAFTGGVILIGDDLSQGAGFSIESLTGLHFNNNGTSMSCNGHSYGYDNLAGYSYQVNLNEEFLPGVSAAYQNFQYGNDLDWTTPDVGTQVLAWASAAANTCNIGQVPAVVRHER